MNTALYIFETESVVVKLFLNTRSNTLALHSDVIVYVCTYGPLFCVVKRIILPPPLGSTVAPGGYQYTKASITTITTITITKKNGILPHLTISYCNVRLTGCRAIISEVPDYKGFAVSDVEVTCYVMTCRGKLSYKGTSRRRYTLQNISIERLQLQMSLIIILY